MLPVFIMAIEDDSDRQFAAELYHSYHSIMHQKALSILKKEDLAEDAVQDAMLKIICHLDKIREIPKREIPFYLIAITQTTCIDPPALTATVKYKGKSKPVSWAMKMMGPKNFQIQRLRKKYLFIQIKLSC